MIKNEEFIQEFIEEARTHTETVEALLLKKEDVRNSSDSINKVFRAVHSIKGTAGFFGLKKIVSLAHAMENVFGEIRNGVICYDSRIVDIILRANDNMKDMINDIENSENTDLSEMIDELNKVLNEVETTDGKKENLITVKNEKKKINFTGSDYYILVDGIKHGHSLYEIKLKMNRDLLNYDEGPVKLFNKIQSIGMLIDIGIDHSEINSFEDVLNAMSEGGRDVYICLVITTVLDKELFAAAIGISPDNICEMEIENPDVSKEETEEAEKTDNRNETPILLEKKESVLSNDSNVSNDLNINGEKRNGEKQVLQKSLKIEDNIRVNVTILNDLLNMASEMVLGRNQLLRTLEGYRKVVPNLSSILQNIDRLTSGMQEKIMQTRMQPLSNVFNKFPRIIRELSKDIGKSMELLIDGEGVELDKSVIESLADPLTHLVRNSADHGIETADERKKCGKASVGTIKLNAYHEGGHVYIDVIDDGKGIDVKKVAEKAIEKSIVSSEEIGRMSELEILRLVLRAGFSTAEKISDISGRGVGMDVAVNNIEKLGGSIEIFTIKGKGTTMRLILPMTLAIIQSFIIESGGQKFAVPQANLKEIVQVKNGDASKMIEYLNDAEVIRLRGRLMPIVHLSDILGMQKKMSKSVHVLILRVGSRNFGLAVDAVLTTEETLVKPLPIYLKTCECYSGVTIMGDGKTAIILDVEGVMNLSEMKFRDENEMAVNEVKNDKDTLIEKQNLLLFKCTGDEIFAVDLSMIARVEEINVSDISKIGEKEYIKFRGDMLRIIHPENYLEVSNGVSQHEKKCILIPKNVKHPIGIVAENIIDNINIKLELNSEDVKIEGILGTTIYDNKILLIMDIYKLFNKAEPEHYTDENRIGGTGKILIVEDTPFFQKQEKAYLTEAGFDVIVTYNGRDALAVLKTQKVDCVVSDIQMPIMDGYELVKKIRENDQFKNIPVIALTSMSGESQKKKGLESGFDYYEIKLDRDRLIEKVHEALAKREKGVKMSVENT